MTSGLGFTIVELGSMVIGLGSMVVALVGVSLHAEIISTNTNTGQNNLTLGPQVWLVEVKLNIIFHHLWFETYRLLGHCHLFDDKWGKNPICQVKSQNIMNYIHRAINCTRSTIG